jgi:leucyl/phenylalanyl-tRNA--protein transferase
VTIDRFPPIELADENGLLAVGGDLDVDSLLLAYKSGIFPWPISEEYPIAWFAPNPRGVVQYKDLHLSQSFIKLIKKSNFKVSLNQHFDQVMYECAYAKNRKGQSGTWITPEILNAYHKLHQAGFAYSVEVSLDGQLVGGLYGVTLKNFFCGESMYFKESGASKVALAFWLRLLHQYHIEWLDTQMVTPVVKDMGGTEITRREFMKLLHISQVGPERPVFEKTHFNVDEVREIILSYKAS